MTEINFIEAIKTRKSSRTYIGLVIDDHTINKIKAYIKSLEPPFNCKCRIEILHADSDDKPLKLGTYGFIKGATTFLALVIEEGPLAEEGAAYIFERTILYCTSIGLGTCWLGVSFNKKTFKEQLNLNSKETLRIVSPVGYPSDKSHLSLFLIFGKNNSYQRKPFSANFFDKTFATALTEESAGVYDQPLEMVRLAPSANNKQPWRIVKEDQMLHFYKVKSSGFESVDLGIALCHFEQTCKALNIEGHYKVLEKAPFSEKASYVISWVY